MQEAIFSKLVNMKKIPYTNSGFAIIEAQIRAVLAQGVLNGGIAPGEYTVVTPDPLSIPETDRAARKAYGWTFTARLAGALHSIVVTGTVTP